MIEIKKEALILNPNNFKPSSNEFQIIGVINPAAVRLPNGEIMLYVRVIERLIKDEDEKYYYSPRMTGKDEFKYVLDKFSKRSVTEKNPLDFVFKDGTKRLTFISHFRKVTLDKSGFRVKSIENKPTFFGTAKDSEYGVEDPRITKIDDDYVMTYVSLNKDTNISTNLAISKDLKTWERKGIIFEEQNKDGVVFPEKIKGKYYALNRPEGNFAFSPPHMWISKSSKLQNWGRSKPLTVSLKGWDSKRVGAGPPPIKTEEGWLAIYHAVTEKEIEENSPMHKFLEYMLKKDKGKKMRSAYNVGVLLLDINNPTRILKKTKTPLFTPHQRYEKGTVENKDVIFPTGIVIDENNEDLLIYSGAGDISIEVKKVALQDILNSLSKFTPLP